MLPAKRLLCGRICWTPLTFIDPKLSRIVFRESFIIAQNTRMTRADLHFQRKYVIVWQKEVRLCCIWDVI